MMECPACHQDVSEQVNECPHCGLAFEPEPGVEPADPSIELTTVLRTGDASLIPVVQSLLDAEGIEYLVKGDQVQDLFGFGRVGASYNIVTGPAEFVVRAEDAARVRDLLREFESTEPGPPEG